MKLAILFGVVLSLVATPMVARPKHPVPRHPPSYTGITPIPILKSGKIPKNLLAPPPNVRGVKRKH